MRALFFLLTVLLGVNLSGSICYGAQYGQPDTLTDSGLREHASEMRKLDAKQQSRQNQMERDAIQRRGDEQLNNMQQGYDQQYNALMQSALQNGSNNDKKFLDNLNYYRGLNQKGKKDFLNSLSASERESFEIRYYRMLSEQRQREIYPELSPQTRAYIDRVNASAAKANSQNLEFEQKESIQLQELAQSYVDKYEQESRQNNQQLMQLMQEQQTNQRLYQFGRFGRY